MSSHKILATLVATVLTFSSLSFANTITINAENLAHMKNMAKSMDPTADPCNNFHQYACGHGVETIDNAAYTTVKYFMEILALLGKQYPLTRKVKQHYTEKIQIYYQTGVNFENAAVLPFLEEVKPGPSQEWPLLEDMLAHSGQERNYTPHAWTRNDFNVLGLLGQLYSYGLNNVLIEHKMMRQDGKVYLVLRAPTPTSIPSKQLMMLLSSTNLPRLVVAKYYVEFVEIHQYLQTIYKQYTSNDEFGAVTYAQLEPQRGIWGHLARFLKQMLPNPAKIEEQSILFHKSYFWFLLNMKWQPEESRKLCNYLMFQFLLHLQESVTPGYHLLSSEIKLALGVNFVYYKHFYLPHKKELEEGFATSIQTLYKHFAETIAENRLNLSAQQMQEITTKFSKITTNIGNLPPNVTESMVEEYYSALPDLDPNNFYKNELLVRRHAHLESLICPSGIICQVSSPHAFYVSDRNLIVFPFTAFMTPMYDPSWHPVFALSLLGIAAGHELMHSIDSSHLSDEDFTPSFGGDSLQVPRIKAAITCLSQQSPTIGVDERLADVIGVQLAFRTYSREFGLQPNFTRTPWQQLFFMSLAQAFCGEVNEVDTDHDQTNIRLHEMVMNSEEFAQAFQCPVGSNMNPVVKCSYI